MLSMLLVMGCLHAETVNVTKTGGWIETAMVQWEPVKGATRYVVEYSGEGVQGVSDDQLVRYYADYVRADIPGLKAGSYTLTVKAYGEDNSVVATSASQTISVTAIKREGFAFTDGVVPGAYNMDGTPKAGAKIIYLTANNANTVTCEVKAGNSTSTYTGLTNILSAYGKGSEKTPLIIRVVGTVKASDIDGLKDGNYINFEGKNASDGALGNITLEGIGDDATLYGYGVCFKRTNGIEVRNLGIMLFGDDAISMDTDNYHNYIHNCDFFYGKPGSEADQVKGDGSIDMKYRSTQTTIAYNHFFDSGKVMGCGGATKEETNLFITFHHNWFDHCDSRCPRLNHTTAHIYNNYYDGVSTYGIGCTEVSNAFIEGNHFRNVQRPMMIAGQGTDYVYASDKNKGTFSGQPGGMSKAYNNKVEGTIEIRLMYQTNNAQEFDAWLVENRADKVPETVKAKKGEHVYDNFDTADGMYDSTPDEPNAVQDIVTSYAGRMYGGDFKWTFDNSVDDTSHDINEALKAAITNYTSKLVKIQGDAESQGGSEGGEGGGGSDNPGTGTATAGGSIVDLMNDANSGFTIVGQTSNDKGSVTINGTTYKTCLKMGSSSSVTFSITEPMQLTLYFAASSSKRLKINDMAELTIPESNIVTTTLPEAGEYTIKRTSGESYLYYIALTPLNPASIQLSKVSGEVVERWFTIGGTEVAAPQKGGVYIRFKGQEKQKVVF
jgi:pectate lyase